MSKMTDILRVLLHTSSSLFDLTCRFTDNCRMGGGRGQRCCGCCMDDDDIGAVPPPPTDGGAGGGGLG